MHRAIFLALLILSAAMPAMAGSAGHAVTRSNSAATTHLPPIRLHGSALQGKERSLSVDELDGLARHTQWTIFDPYRRQDAQYGGIRLTDLVAAVAPQARTVRMRAINDYITVFDRQEWETQPILLATRDNGARMAVADKGPARIVYLLNRDNELDMQVNAPKWIWQVIDVEFDNP